MSRPVAALLPDPAHARPRSSRRRGHPAARRLAVLGIALAAAPLVPATGSMAGATSGAGTVDADVVVPVGFGPGAPTDTISIHATRDEAGLVGGTVSLATSSGAFYSGVVACVEITGSSAVVGARYLGTGLPGTVSQVFFLEDGPTDLVAVNAMTNVGPADCVSSTPEMTPVAPSAGDVLVTETGPAPTSTMTTTTTAVTSDPGPEPTAVETTTTSTSDAVSTQSTSSQGGVEVSVVSVSIDPPTPVAGAPLDATLVVRNDGPLGAAGGTFALSWASATLLVPDPAFVCDGDTYQLCALPPLPAGSTRTLRVTLLADAGGSFFLTGTVSDPLDSTYANNQASLAAPIGVATGVGPATVAVPAADDPSLVVDLDFSSITAAGTTTARIATSVPAAPDGFRFVAGATAIDLATTATFTGPVAVCLGYDPARYPDESVVRLLHFDGAAWADITTSVDTAANRVCGSTTSFSPFAIAVPLWAFAGPYAPVDAGMRNGLQAGRAVPVRFSLGGNRGLDIFAGGAPTSGRVACDTGVPIDPVEQTVTAGASSLSYDASTGRYTYVWKTDKAWAGTCRALTLAFRDGTTRQLLFQLTR